MARLYLPLSSLPALRLQIEMDIQGLGWEQERNSRTLILNAITLQQCAIAGIALALLPHWLIEKDLHAGTLARSETLL